MSYTLSKHVTQKIIERLLKGENYRVEAINIINSMFLSYCIDFFKVVVDAKFKNKNINLDWYKKEFLNKDLSTEKIAINSGLNKKTISNMYQSARKEIVLDVASEHYDTLRDSIKKLADEDKSLNIQLNIKFKRVSVELDICESLVVINALAVKRAALRGGVWSTVGKRVEKPLMETLCMIFEVPSKNYRSVFKKAGDSDLGFEREVDFYLIDRNQKDIKCEVKLMGRGNPESADVVVARGSKVFIADKLSETNKVQLAYLDVECVELASENGYLQFEKVLKAFEIPHKSIKDLSKINMDSIFKKIF